MNTTYETHLVKEFHDLIAISVLDPELKTVLQDKVSNSSFSTDDFAEVLKLLREEDQIEKDIHQQELALANFDSDKYLAQVQKVVDEEVRKLVKA